MLMKLEEEKIIPIKVKSIKFSGGSGTEFNPFLTSTEPTNGVVYAFVKNMPEEKVKKALDEKLLY